MGNLIQGNINFTIDTENIGGFGTKRVNSLNNCLITKNKKYDVTTKQSFINGPSDEMWKVFSINAIDIDWNTAELPNSNLDGGLKTISNTGELLNLINEIQKEIYALSAAIIALSNR